MASSSSSNNISSEEDLQEDEETPLLTRVGGFAVQQKGYYDASILSSTFDNNTNTNVSTKSSKEWQQPSSSSSSITTLLETPIFFISERLVHNELLARQRRRLLVFIFVVVPTIILLTILAYDGVGHTSVSWKRNEAKKNQHKKKKQEQGGDDKEDDDDNDDTLSRPGSWLGTSGLLVQEVVRKTRRNFSKIVIVLINDQGGDGDDDDDDGSDKKENRKHENRNNAKDSNIEEHEEDNKDNGAVKEIRTQRDVDDIYIDDDGVKKEVNSDEENDNKSDTDDGKGSDTGNERSCEPQDWRCWRDKYKSSSSGKIQESVSEPTVAPQPNPTSSPTWALAAALEDVVCQTKDWKCWKNKYEQLSNSSNSSTERPTFEPTSKPTSHPTPSPVVEPEDSLSIQPDEAECEPKDWKCWMNKYKSIVTTHDDKHSVSNFKSEATSLDSSPTSSNDESHSQQPNISQNPIDSIPPSTSQTPEILLTDALPTENLLLSRDQPPSPSETPEPILTESLATAKLPLSMEKSSKESSIVPQATHTEPSAENNVPGTTPMEAAVQYSPALGKSVEVQATVAPSTTDEQESVEENATVAFEGGDDGVAMVGNGTLANLEQRNTKAKTTKNDKKEEAPKVIEKQSKALKKWDEKKPKGVSYCEDGEYSKRTLNLAYEMPFQGLFRDKKGQHHFEASSVIVVDGVAYAICDSSWSISMFDPYLHPFGQHNYQIGDPYREPADSGYEAMFYDQGTFYVIRESVKNVNQTYHAIIEEIIFDPTVGLDSYQLGESCPTDFEFEGLSKGFEGAIPVHDLNGNLVVLGLCEGNHCSETEELKQDKGNGRLVAMIHETFPNGSCQWTTIRIIKIPETANFGDYSSIDMDASGRVILSSQEESQLWVGYLEGIQPDGLWDVMGMAFQEDNYEIYDFPRNGNCEIMYCNIEGIHWVDDYTILAVSDKMKSKGRQPYSCFEKDQSAHLFVFP